MQEIYRHVFYEILLILVLTGYFYQVVLTFVNFLNSKPSDLYLIVCICKRFNPKFIFKFSLKTVLRPHLIRSLESSTEGSAGQLLMDNAQWTESIKHIKTLGKIKKECYTAKISVFNAIVKLVDERANIAEFGEIHVWKRMPSVFRDPILSTRVEQIRIITTKHLKTLDSFIETSRRIDRLKEIIHTEDHSYRELVLESDLESSKHMSIPDLKVVIGSWNLRLKLILRMKAFMDGFLAEWNEHPALQEHHECAKLIDYLWIDNQFAIY